MSGWCVAKTVTAKIETLEPRSSGASFFLTEMLPLRFETFGLVLQMGCYQVKSEGRRGESRKRIETALFLQGLVRLSAIPGFSQLVYAICNLRRFR